MSAPNTSTQTSTNTNTSSGSGPSDEIGAAKDRVTEDEADADRANKWLLRLFAIYLVAQFGMAGATLWAYKANKQLRKSDSIVSALYQERAAKAESQIWKAQMPRVLSFDFETFVNSLRNKPKGSVILLYQAGDPEARVFAEALKTRLGEAGWTAAKPKPDPISVDKYGWSGGNRPSSGVIVTTGPHNPPSGFPVANTALGALENAFLLAGGGYLGAGDDSLPEDVFVVAVRQKD